MKMMTVFFFFFFFFLFVCVCAFFQESLYIVNEEWVRNYVSKLCVRFRKGFESLLDTVLNT